VIGENNDDQVEIHWVIGTCFRRTLLWVVLACGSFAAGAIFLAGLMQTNGCCLQIADEIVSENSTCLAAIPNLF